MKDQERARVLEAAASAETVMVHRIHRALCEERLYRAAEVVRKRFMDDDGRET